MTFGDVPQESFVGFIGVMKTRQTDASRKSADMPVLSVWTALSAHILLLMAPTFSSSALIAVNTGPCWPALSALHAPLGYQAKMTIW